MSTAGGVAEGPTEKRWTGPRQAGLSTTTSSNPAVATRRATSRQNAVAPGLLVVYRISHRPGKRASTAAAAAAPTPRRR